ncbi:hypothetical protein DMENIID0001_076420 [Sergentomyia squamirostris]
MEAPPTVEGSATATPPTASVRDDDADAVSLTPSTTSRRGTCRRHPHHQHRGHHHHYRHRRTPSTSSTASAGCRRSHSPGGTRYDASPPRVFIERCCSALDDEVERYFYVQNRRSSSGGGSAIVYGSHGSLSRLSRCNSMRRRRSHTTIAVPSADAPRTPVPTRGFRAISPKPVSENGVARMLLTPSKLTVEATSSRCSSAMKCSSSETSELPDYVYAPSPIKWHFPSDVEKMSDGSSSSGSVASADSQVAVKKKHPGDVKTVSIWRTDNDEANAIIFHHESEIVENCCRPPPIQHLDGETDSDMEYPSDHDKLNNRMASNPPATIEMSHRNSFPSANQSLYRISSDLRRFQKSSNFSHNINNINVASSGKLTNCEPSTSRHLVEQAANNLTDIFSRSLEQVLMRASIMDTSKSINGSTSHNTLPHCTDLLFRTSPPLSHTAAAHSLARRYDKSPANISLTNQNRFTHYFNADRRQSVNVLMPSTSATDSDPASQQSPTASDEAILEGQSSAPLHRLRMLSHGIGLSNFYRVVRRRAKKCKDFLRRGSID